VYYMSMEFLMGRSLLNALFNLDVAGAYGEALTEMGYSLERLVEQERDAVSMQLCLNLSRISKFVCRNGLQLRAPRGAGAGRVSGAHIHLRMLRNVVG